MRRTLVFTLPGGVELPLHVAPPVPPAGQWWPVLRLPPGGKIDCLILSDRLFDAYTHFIGKSGQKHSQTVPCLKDLGTECEFCPSISRRWQGWLAVHAAGTAVPALVQITLLAYLGEPKLAPTAEPLFGQLLRLRRVSPGAQGRVRAEVLEPERLTTNHPVISCTDVKAQVLHMWGVSFREEKDDEIR